MKRVTIVTLGVKDLKRSQEFFAKLFDWRPKDDQSENIVFYNMGGWMLALYPWELLAEDAMVESSKAGFAGITLAHNVIEKKEVKEVLDLANKLGAQVIKPAQDVFWGGHSGYFKDLDGHLWEVAYNPFTKTLADGTLDLPTVD